MTASSRELPTQPIFVGGRFEPSAGKESYDAVDPTTEQILARLPESTEDDLERAVDAARIAQPSWAGVAWQRRAQVLRDFADALSERAEEFAALDVADSGNPIGAMRDDAAGGIQELRYHVGLAPELKGHTQPITERSVVFPLPDGPTSIRNSPAFTVRSASWTACTASAPVP